MGDTLIDDVAADFGQPVNVGFTRTEVAALDCVIEEAVNAVAIVLIILRRVNSTLSRNRVRPPRRILVAKTFHQITQLAEGRRRRASGQAAADNDDLEFAAVVWTDEPRVILMVRPFFCQRPTRNLWIETADHSQRQ